MKRSIWRTISVNKLKLSFLKISGLTVLCLCVWSCNFYKTDVETVGEGGEPAALKDFEVKSPTKLHLLDGSVVLYDTGFEVKQGQILGSGEHYDLTRFKQTKVTSVSISDVAFLEYYDRKNRRTISGLATVAAVGGGTVGTILLYKAIFGSCPTVYSQGTQGPVLEAELFSHSISSRYEAGDLDRLDISHNINNNLSIDVINEALETHYINKINILAVDHPRGYEAFPTPDRGVLLVGRSEELLEATSKAGEDIKGLIVSRDQKYYQSGEAPLRAFTQQVDTDWIDLSVKVPKDARNIYLSVRARNTLLATVFLYDIAIGSQGFYALDWMGSEIASPWYAWRFADWFQENFGIEVSVADGDSYRMVERIAPTGPIAWNQIATGFAIPKGDIARLRMTFMPDNWAIDWLAVSFDSAESVQKTLLKPSNIVGVRGNKLSQVEGILDDKDRDYFITYPGDRYRLEFSVDEVAAGIQRTYFVSSSGYYIEWLRMNWIEENESYGPKIPLKLNDDLLKRTAKRWLERRNTMESQFYGSRLPLVQ